MPRGNPIFDAVDADGATWQVKSRQVPLVTTRTSFDFDDLRIPFDTLACVLYDENTGETLTAFHMPYAVALEHERKAGNRVAWKRKMREDPRITWLIGTPPTE
jgi:hypothetical protein